MCKRYGHKILSALIRRTATIYGEGDSYGQKGRKKGTDLLFGTENKSVPFFVPQIQPDTFEYAVNWIVDHDVDLSVFDAR